MLNQFIAGLLLPVVASILLLRRPRNPAGGWIATFVLAVGMVAFSFFVIAWGLIGMAIRYAVAALFAAALVISLVRKPDDRPEDTPTRMMLKILIGLFFGSVALGVVRAYSTPPGTTDLGFPLGNGTYAVVHGGSTTAANTYFGRGAQSFGVDVVKAGGAMTGQPVLSPCDGTVVLAKPLRLRCGDVLVEVTTAEATESGGVRRGAPIGKVTAESLHIHAQRNGQPVPLTFDGRWLVRNAVVRK